MKARLTPTNRKYMPSNAATREHDKTISFFLCFYVMLKDFWLCATERAVRGGNVVRKRKRLIKW